MYRRVAVGVNLQSGVRLLGKQGALFRVTMGVAALLWALAHQHGQAGTLGAVVASLFGLFWFRRALAAQGAQSPSSVAPSGLDPLRRLTGWGVVTVRSLGVSVLIVATLTVPTMALAYARIMTLGADTVAETTAAVHWALPIAAVAVSPLLIRLYLYYAALAAGRRDVGLADVWRWGRGNSWRILALVALPLIPAFAIKTVCLALAQSAGVLAMGLRFVAALALFAGLAWAAAALARALSGLLTSPLAVTRRQ